MLLIGELHLHLPIDLHLLMFGIFRLRARVLGTLIVILRRYQGLCGEGVLEDIESSWLLGNREQID
jgi:hypothetical protein